jgi:hypothetical protein
MKSYHLDIAFALAFAAGCSEPNAEFNPADLCDDMPPTVVHVIAADETGDPIQWVGALEDGERAHYGLWSNGMTRRFDTSEASVRCWPNGRVAESCYSTDRDDCACYDTAGNGQDCGETLDLWHTLESQFLGAYAVDTL